MSFEQSKWIWMNGELVPWEKATVHVSVHGLHYGSGVFEGIRCYDTAEGPAVFRLDAHLERLRKSAEVYGIQIPFTQHELAEAVSATITRNEFASCYVRPICFYGSDSLGVHPRDCPIEVVIFAWPWATYLGKEGLVKGIRTTVSPWRKFGSDVVPAVAKACGQYLNSILAVRDAVARGFDEALLLDSDGYVAEGSGENLFVIKNGEIVTNDERHSILMGVTRASVIQIGQDLGYAVVTRRIELGELLSADEAFFTGTAAEVTPIREVDGTIIGSGTLGPITEKIQRTFFAATQAKVSQYRHWLQLVSESVLTRS
ncbi:MAG: branched-chain amino acid transaminase [Pyrinomonadaceae bacterium]